MRIISFLLCSSLLFPQRILTPILSTSAGSSLTSWVTGGTFGSIRNDFTGAVGVKFTTGGSGVTALALQEWVVSGNTGTHTVCLANSSQVVLGSVSVNTSGAPVGFKSVALGSSIALSASSTYYLVMDVTNGGDSWYDSMPITVTGVATVTNAVFSVALQCGTATGIWLTDAGAGLTFGPVSFQY